MSESLEAKKKLYKLLLNKKDDITDNEIEIMYRLALDNEIQDFLQSHIGEIKC